MIAIAEPKRGVVKQPALVYVSAIAQSMSLLGRELLNCLVPCCHTAVLRLSAARGEISNSSREKEEGNKSLNGSLKLVTPVDAEVSAS